MAGVTDNTCHRGSIGTMNPKPDFLGIQHASRFQDYRRKQSMNIPASLQNGPIYLDYNATTPVDPAVVEAMLPYLSTHFGNPSSSHHYGQLTHRAIDTAREQVAQLIGCLPGEIIFTGGGSESDNLAIRGATLARRSRGDHIITQVTEHPAVLNTCRALARLHGFRV